MGAKLQGTVDILSERSVKCLLFWRLWLCYLCCMFERNIVPEYPVKGGRHVLIVEKDPLQGYLLKASLQDAGWVVCLVEEPDEGLNCCEHSIFDVAIINCSYPDGTDGFVLAKLLWGSQNLPCLMITANRYTDLESLPSFSAEQELIFKPYRLMEFDKSLDNLLTKLRGTGRTYFEIL